MAKAKEIAKLSDLHPDSNNYNKGTEFGGSLINKSIKRLGAGRSILIDKNGKIIAGNKTFENLIDAGFDDSDLIVVKTDGTKLVAVQRVDLDLDTKRGKEMALADNATAKANIAWAANALNSEWDTEGLKEWGVDLQEFGEGEKDGGDTAEKHRSLVDVFLIPPFSIFDTRLGYWQDRKRAWLAKGIKSEIGRGAKAFASQTLLENIMQTAWQGDGTSIFDPVICEVCYNWFNTPNGKILDPFAGGSVRGLVASLLGYKYTGVELRSEQVDANIENAAEVLLSEGYEKPIWHCGDSMDIDKICEGQQYDFIFSCPPYADLEVYSDLPNDISNMEYPEFVEAYRAIIKKTASLLADNRFACFVIGEVRGKNGAYLGFVPETIQAFESAGLKFYNEMILVNVAGSLPVRAARAFNSGRKVGKMHQNILAFYKGDPKRIKENFPEIDMSTILETTET